MLSAGGERHGKERNLRRPRRPKDERKRRRSTTLARHTHVETTERC
jgi:hypothetical protein